MVDFYVSNSKRKRSLHTFAAPSIHFIQKLGVGFSLLLLLSGLLHARTPGTARTIAAQILATPVGHTAKTAGLKAAAGLQSKAAMALATKATAGRAGSPATVDALIRSGVIKTPGATMGVEANSVMAARRTVLSADTPQHTRYSLADQIAAKISQE